MKKFFAGLIIGLIAALSIGIFAAEEYMIKENTYPIVANGESKDGIKALNIDGYTYLKLADIAKATNEAIGVKFDEVKEVIEISVKTVPNKAMSELDGSGAAKRAKFANMQPKNSPGKPPMFDKETPLKVEETPKPNISMPYEIDGLDAKNIDGKVYVVPASIKNKHTNEIEFIYNGNSKTISAHNIKTKKVIESVPYTEFELKIYIEYDYYLKTLLPLINDK